ncbi:MAG: DUF3368 domain-containing protein [Candidatus Altiarchaeota archaeon]|nr:DUF3368 domain-containing protein [Candidatus Altiarchaeota archaeon]
MIVSNASPLIYLAKVGKLHLLKELFGKILIEEEVKREVVDRGKEEGAADSIVIEESIREGWIIVKRIKDKRKFKGIHLGETNTILLAKELESMALIDEEDAREVARAFGLKTRGTLYVLKRCQEQGIISKKEAIRILDDMLSEGFRLSAHLYTEFVRRLG